MYYFILSLYLQFSKFTKILLILHVPTFHVVQYTFTCFGYISTILEHFTTFQNILWFDTFWTLLGTFHKFLVYHGAHMYVWCVLIHFKNFSYLEHFRVYGCFRLILEHFGYILVQISTSHFSPFGIFCTFGIFRQSIQILMHFGTSWRTLIHFSHFYLFLIYFFLSYCAISSTLIHFG